MSYNWVSREELVEMDYGALLRQYHSLVDWIKENKGFTFERKPELSKGELVETIFEGQINFDELVMISLADSLERWGAKNLDKIVITSGS